MKESGLGVVRDIQGETGQHRWMLLCSRVQESGRQVSQRCRNVVAIPLQEFGHSKAGVRSVEIGITVFRMTRQMAAENDLGDNVTSVVTGIFHQCQVKGAGSTLPQLDGVLNTLKHAS